MTALLKALTGKLLMPLLRLFGYGSAGVALTLVVFFVPCLESRPDLEPWQTAELDLEFTTGSALASFEEYVILEDRLSAISLQPGPCSTIRA